MFYSPGAWEMNMRGYNEALKVVCAEHIDIDAFKSTPKKFRSASPKINATRDIDSLDTLLGLPLLELIAAQKQPLNIWKRWRISDMNALAKLPIPFDQVGRIKKMQYIGDRKLKLVLYV